MCHVHFSNKVMKLIDLPSVFNNTSLFNNTNVTSSNTIFTNFPTTTVVYNLPKLIRSTIFNFNRVTLQVNIDEFLSAPDHFLCNCCNSPYTDKNQGHIVTGNLRLIKNNQLHKHFCKASKYKTPTSINFHDAKKVYFLVQMSV